MDLHFQKRPLRKQRWRPTTSPILPGRSARQTAQKLKIIVLRYSFLRMVFGRRRTFGSRDPSFVGNLLSATNGLL